MMVETSKQKEPLLQEALFVAPDEVRNVRTISVCDEYTPIYEDVKKRYQQPNSDEYIKNSLLSFSRGEAEALYA